MTKLKEKLKELGYREHIMVFDVYISTKHNCRCKIEILNPETNKIKGGVDPLISITKQEQIFDLQLAFNELQKDLKLLKDCVGDSDE